MLIWQQAVLAVTAEGGALALLQSSTSSMRLLAYFAAHSVAAAIATAMAWALMPKRLQVDRMGALALIYSFGFFIPGLGVVASVAVVLVAARFPKAVGTDRYVEIVQPRFMATEKDKTGASDIRTGFARRILHDPAESVDTKLRVLIALQDMRPKVAIPMLQSLLGDPAEDIRLLAYSMMDAWEKDITKSVQTAQEQLLAAHEKGDKALTFNANRRLAELYWQQVDTQLARGDLRIFALQQAKQHCEVALEQQPNAAGVWMLYSTVLLELDMKTLARRTLSLAKAAGGNAVEIHRLKAQLAWQEGDYRAVRSRMRKIVVSARAPYGLKQVARFWSGTTVDVVI